MNTKNLWIDESNAADWAALCQREIANWLSVIIGPSSLASEIKIEVRPTSKKAARQAYGLNRTLTGEIVFRLADQEASISLPMSFNGVFFFHREGSGRALPSVWPSWLAERQGFRVVIPTDETRRAQAMGEDKTRSREALEWRLGLPDGSWIGAPLKPSKSLSDSEAKRLRKHQPVYMGCPEVPEWLTQELSIYGPGSKADGKRRPLQQTIWNAIHDRILENGGGAALDLSQATDEDDLNHAVLMTFPLWLRHRISWGLLQGLLPVTGGRGKRGKSEKNESDPNRAMRERVASILMGEAEPDPALAEPVYEMLWNAIPSLGAKVQFALNNYRSDERTDYIEPINPLDLAARITRIRRYPVASRFLEEKAEEFRQNHPSFEGRICPVDSPESGMVGLTLHLAAGATVDLDGRIHPASKDTGKLSFGAGLVPFFGHNDGARNMMGAKNLRQAIPVHGAETASILTGGEGAVTQFVKPLLDIGVCPKAMDAQGRLMLGRDLLVAYMPWYGMNIEDAVVVSESAAESLGCENLRKAPIRKPIPVDWELSAPESPSDHPDLDSKGLIKAGTKVFPNTPLACFALKTAKGEPQRFIRYKDRTTAVVKSVRFHRKNQWMTGSLEIEFELPIPARPGDKLMGRHGNKGVIGTILPEEKMPRLPKSEQIPKSLRGRAIDIVLNPHGVVGRMNLGQLLETHVGWLLHCGTEVRQILKGGSEGAFASAFSDCLDHDKVQAALELSGLDRYGRIQLTLPGGKRTLAPVVVGFQHIVRLRHIPELKCQARRGGEDALYSARTGQAIHGRKLGGGQRVGEMEIWALEGHQAHAILDEMLGVKSSADVIKDGGIEGTAGYSGYPRVLKDWLFAMGVDLATTESEVRFGFPSPQAILNRIGKENRVTIPGGYQSRVAAAFRCTHGTKHHPCPHQLLDGEKIVFRPSQSSDEATLTLADLLEHLHLEPVGKLVKEKSGYRLAMRDTHTKEPIGQMQFELSPHGKDAVTGVVRFVISSPAASADQLAELASEIGHAGWTKPTPPAERNLNGVEVHLYNRFGKGVTRGGGNPSGESVIKQFLDADPSSWLRQHKNREDGNRHVTDLNIICPKHKGKAFTGQKPFGEHFTSVDGGLLDPQIFGNYETAFRSDHLWGYIELPIPVRFPVHVFLTKSKKDTDQQKAIARFVEKLREAGTSLDSIPDVQIVPVPPVRYRIPFRMHGRIASNDLDLHGYIPLIQACEAYRRKPTPQCAAWLKGQVARLFRKLAEALDTKDGLIRRDGLGRRVDRSARLVVTPNPELPWDVVGVPVPVLFELIGDLVRKWRDGLQPAMAEKLPHLPGRSWIALADDPKAIDSANALIEAFLAANPEFVLLLNRQPSLHRDSFQAFTPRPLPLNAGDVIQLCPLACKGFAADFDGDEMVIHIPVGEAAQAEARRMMPSANLHSLATASGDGENVLAHFDQDFVIGTWLLGKPDPVGLRAEFLDGLPKGDVRTCASGWGSYPAKSEGAKLLATLTANSNLDASAIIANWMRTALKACTEAGVSFGFYELRELSAAIRKEASLECKERVEALREEFGSDKDPNSTLESLAKRVVGDKASKGALGDPGFGFTAIVESGAKGKPEQLRQILAARGLLYPGKMGFSPSDDSGWSRFFIPVSLCEGLNFHQSFWAAMNARTSMVDKKLGTGFGGGLTRSLVFALWPMRISAEDCGNPSSGILSCNEKNGICAKCYGALPHNGKLANIGFPAGLIAAQSIGERGTQLSMQSFHGGKKVIDIHEARKLIKTPSKLGCGSFEKFVDRLKEASAYKKILSRHFEVVWRAISSRENGSVDDVIRSHDPMTLLGYRHSPGQMLLTALTCSGAPRNGPVARILTGRSRSQNPRQEVTHAK